MSRDLANERNISSILLSRRVTGDALDEIHDLALKTWQCEPFRLLASQARTTTIRMGFKPLHRRGERSGRRVRKEDASSRLRLVGRNDRLRRATSPQGDHGCAPQAWASSGTMPKSSNVGNSSARQVCSSWRIVSFDCQPRNSTSEPAIAWSRLRSGPPDNDEPAA